jgi:predicted Zn-dependent peptidase
MVLAAAGNMNHRQLAELGRAALRGTCPNEFFGFDRRSHARGSSCDHPKPQGGAGAVTPPDGGSARIRAVSDDRYVCHLLSVILGGGMSSRLFQSVREERGLVYTIYAAVNPFFDCGNLNIYAATSAERMTETIEATLNEIRRLRQHQIGEPELRRNKEQLKASLMLNPESTSSRMSSLAHSEMTFGRNMTPEEVIRRGRGGNG